MPRGWRKPMVSNDIFTGLIQCTRSTIIWFVLCGQSLNLYVHVSAEHSDLATNDRQALISVDLSPFPPRIMIDVSTDSQLSGQLYSLCRPYPPRRKSGRAEKRSKCTSWISMSLTTAKSVESPWTSALCWPGHGSGMCLSSEIPSLILLGQKLPKRPTYECCFQVNCIFQFIIYTACTCRDGRELVDGEYWCRHCHW